MTSIFLAPAKYYDYSIFLAPVKGPMVIPVMAKKKAEMETPEA